MDIFLLWWFAQANVISGVLVGASVILGVSLVFGCFAWAMVDEDSIIDCERAFCRNAPSILKKGAAAFAIAFVGVVVIPDRTGLAIIVGGKLSLDAIKSEEVTETAGKLYELVNRELDNRLQETEPEESE